MGRVKISEFDYDLPPALIAQRPTEKRETSRLMVVHRDCGDIEHHHFRDLPQFLSSEDLVVLNETRVFPARLYARKGGTGAHLEVLLVRRHRNDLWDALIRPARRAKSGNRLIFEPNCLEAEVVESPPSTTRRLRFTYKGEFWERIERQGKMPLPPYIEREANQEDRKRYQTVYARALGSIAAPTAGLHFTPELLQQLSRCQITLHVGYGTFKPVSVEEIEDHIMEPEYYKVSAQAAARIQEHREAGRRIIAVGSTTTRVLEHIFSQRGVIVAEKGWTKLFIRPGFRFQVVGGLVTNFHLPKSTLLLLVSVFAGKELIEKCYREAIARQYRFYSYGDAMLIL